ncbi:MAG TPA: VOC family protein [Rhizobiaceae bacterium]|nr:VOC family protein [Rhizobiaceae bacterium]
MYYIHTTVVTDDVEQSKAFYANKLGVTAFREIGDPNGAFHAAFIAAPDDQESARSPRFSPALALVRHAGRPNARPGISHVCFRVADLYAICEKVANAGYRFKVPPRDGFRALVHTPEGAVIEFHQAGERRTPVEPWLSMPDSE